MMGSCGSYCCAYKAEVEVFLTLIEEVFSDEECLLRSRSSSCEQTFSGTPIHDIHDAAKVMRFVRRCYERCG